MKMELRKAAKAVYLAADEGVASHLSKIMNDAADRIDELESELSSQEVRVKRVKILIEYWKREVYFPLTPSNEDPSEYADGYARAMGNCAIRLEELVVDDVEERKVKQMIEAQSGRPHQPPRGDEK